MLDQSLTVVLPMYNCERQLRSSVLEILELAASMSRPMDVVIVDDGSTDDTYDAACELALLYPQISVLRQSLRQGLNAALDLVRNRLAAEVVVVHNGVSAIDATQLQMLLQADPTQSDLRENQATTNSRAMESYGSRRFAAVRSLHERMERAHGSALGFRWVQLEKPLIPRRCRPVSEPQASGLVNAPIAPLSQANLPVGMSNLPLS